jgi:hypothetical protein
LPEVETETSDSQQSRRRSKERGRDKPAFQLLVLAYVVAEIADLAQADNLMQVNSAHCTSISTRMVLSKQPGTAIENGTEYAVDGTTEGKNGKSDMSTGMLGSSSKWLALTIAGLLLLARRRQ